MITANVTIMGTEWDEATLRAELTHQQQAWVCLRRVPEIEMENRRKLTEKEKRQKWSDTL